MQKEITRLTLKLKQELTDQQIEGLQAFTRKIKDKVKLANGIFEAKRKILDNLNVQVELAVENGEEVVYIECDLRDGIFFTNHSN